jgi:hypothetical protein
MFEKLWFGRLAGLLAEHDGLVLAGAARCRLGSPGCLLFDRPLEGIRTGSASVRIDVQTRMSCPAGADAAARAGLTLISVDYPGLAVQHTAMVTVRVKYLYFGDSRTSAPDGYVTLGSATAER